FLQRPADFYQLVVDLARALLVAIEHALFERRVERVGTRTGNGRRVRRHDFLPKSPLDALQAGLPSCYLDQGPKGGMSLEGFRGKTGARFSRNDLMPSWASAAAAR